MQPTSQSTITGVWPCTIKRLKAHDLHHSPWANLGLETWGKNTHLFIYLSIYLCHLIQLHTHTHTESVKESCEITWHEQKMAHSPSDTPEMKSVLTEIPPSYVFPIWHWDLSEKMSTNAACRHLSARKKNMYHTEEINLTPKHNTHTCTHMYEHTNTHTHIYLNGHFSAYQR